VLLLDQIDEHVATHVLPVLEENAPYRLGDEAFASSEGMALSARAGKVVRDEIAVALGKDAGAAQQIATLLGERAGMIEAWREALDARGWRMPRTDKLFLPEALLPSLEGVISNRELDRARAIDDELARLEAPRIASLVHQLVAATVRRHEAQHGLDDDRPEPLRYPTQLEAFLGPATNGEGEPIRYVERCRAELSAYTSQLANDPRTTHLSLWNVVRFALSDDHVNSPEFYAGVLVLEGLARQLKIPSPGPAIHDRRVDRDRLLEIAMKIVAIDGGRLRAAAVELWRELYGENLVAITDR